MAENNETNGKNAQQEAVQGQFNILAQYIKDLSFENPNAPDSLRIQGTKPQMNVDVNVNGEKKSDDLFEVELVVEAHGKTEKGTIYKLDLVYAGLFRIAGLPDQAIHQIMFINCPTLLFPYARELTSHLTISGGFPPLFLEPIDFAGLYKAKVEEMQAQQQGEKNEKLDS